MWEVFRVCRGERRGKERVGFVFRRKYAGKEKPFECFLRLSNRAYRNGEIFIKRAGEGIGGLGERETPLARAEGFPFPPEKTPALLSGRRGGGGGNGGDVHLPAGQAFEGDPALMAVAEPVGVNDAHAGPPVALFDKEQGFFGDEVQSHETFVEIDFRGFAVADFPAGRGGRFAQGFRDGVAQLAVRFVDAGRFGLRRGGGSGRAQQVQRAAEQRKTDKGHQKEKAGRFHRSSFAG